jgi:glutathione S-transferase
MSKLLLYFAPGACSLAPHILLREAGLEFDLEKVDLRTHQTSHGEDFEAINPKGYVPALRLADGQLLTEVAVILLYVADQVPERHLAPAPASFERYRILERLNYLATEIHKGFSPLFSPHTPDDLRPFLRERILARLAPLDLVLAQQPFLGGDKLDVTDAYLVTLLNWARWTQVDLSALTHISAYKERLLAHPAVHDAIEAEKSLRTHTAPRVDTAS